MFTWLAEVVKWLGATPPQVETMKHLLKKLTISFEIPSREDLGTMILIVASGKESPIRMTCERSAMEAYLHGYLIPDLSLFKIKVLQKNVGSRLVSVRSLHMKIYMTWYVGSCNLKILYMVLL